jgi:hypothetical protein
MNYYRKLQKKYYELFPEEKKLEFGCEVLLMLYGDNNRTPVKAMLLDTFENPKGYKSRYWHTFLILDRGMRTAYGETTNNRRLHNDSYHSEIIEVYGKPLALQMILRMFQNSNKNMSWTMDTNIGFTVVNDETIKIFERLDLSKEPKDYPEETLQAIYELIK